MKINKKPTLKTTALGFAILIVFVIVLLLVASNEFPNEFKQARKSAIESKESVIEGRLFSIYIDDFINPENSRLEYIIDSSEGFFTLKNVNLFSITPGSDIRVTGKIQENNFIVSEGGLSIQSQGIPTDSGFNLGENNILVLIGEYDDRPFTHEVADVERVLFGSYPSMDDFFQEASNRESWFEGDVIGPLNLGSESLPCIIPNIDEYADALIQAADPIVDFTDYKRILFIFTECWIGVAEVGYSFRTTPDGDVYQSWAWSGYPSIDWPSPPDDIFLDVTTHEMGHNFGALHASFADCGDISFGEDISDCVNLEYGNPYSIMGAGIPLQHFTATQKQILGWLDPYDIIVASSGTFTLSPLETGTGTRRIVLPYGIVDDFSFTGLYGPEEGYYSIEYRQPIGYDGDFWPIEEYRYGVFVTFNSEPIEEGAVWWLSYDHLIYADPELPICPPDCLGYQWYSSLQEGESYRDNNIGRTIKVLSMDETGATIQIRISSQTKGPGEPAS